MYNILTLNKIDPQGLNRFPCENYRISSEVSNPDAVVLRSYSMHDMELPSGLKAIARAGAGVNNIPIDKCTELGIVVFNTPGANANGVKELVIAGMLLASRDVIGGVNWAQTLIGQGDQVGALVEKGKSNFGGTEIMGKTLAVIGLGAIGMLVANASQKLGMKIIGYDPYLSHEQASKLDAGIVVETSLDKVVAAADFITLHVPLVPETKNLINKEKIARMQPHVKILNFSRSGLVNDSDLAEALQNGKVAKYVTDFPDEATLKIKNAICIPHLGASTEESETNCAIMAVDQIRDYLENGNIINSVNFPTITLERDANNLRIVVAGKNMADVLKPATNILKAEGIQVKAMISKSRNNISYGIIDVDKKEITDALKQKIAATDGIFMTCAL
ncbi:MAG: 3-phosphoglycerate dehydrogenase family protein [Prolixibacteraceae bacterium]|nr:3-phosphoglycerate dehydrogenase family protein [Prolixibacteraceae bacterium]